MKRDLPKYPEYKSSEIAWIGSIPKNWSLYRLKFCADIIDCKNRTPEVIPDAKYLVVRTTNVKNGKLILDDAHYTDENNFEEWTKRGVPPPGSVLFTREAPAGEVCLVPENLPLCLGQRMMNFIPRKNLFSRFALYSFQSKGVAQFIEASSDGSTVSHLRVRQVYDFPICVPPIDEQFAIIKFLDRETAKIDRLIEVRRKQIEQLQEQRTAVIHHAVTKGLDPNARMKPSGMEWLEDVPVHWQVLRLKFAAQINPSKTASGYDSSSLDEVIFLPMECIGTDGTIDESNRAKICDLWKGFTYFAKGDVLVAKITPCFENGKGALVSDLATDIGFGTTELHVLRVGNQIDPRFLFSITSSYRFRGIGERFMTGAAGQQRVSEQFIADFPIALPPAEEQKAIVAHIERETKKIDALIDKYRRETALLEEYRAALISHAVTGKIDVRGVVATAEGEVSLAPVGAECL